MITKQDNLNLSLIVAYTKNRVIGKDNAMPWHLPADLKHFKEVTLGKPVIMGRKTYDSIGRALPGRKNLVVSGQSDLLIAGVTVVHSLEEAIEEANRDYHGEIMIIGGARLYQQAIGSAKRIYVTEIDAIIEGDAFFPALAADGWIYESTGFHAMDEKNQFRLDFGIYTRTNTI